MKIFILQFWPESFRNIYRLYFTDLNHRKQRYFLQFQFNSKMFNCFSKKKKDQNHGKFKKPYYCFRSADSGKVLDISQASGNTNQLVIWESKKQDNQKFAIKQKGPDFYIKCKKDKLYLTVDGPQNGARVYGTSKNMGENQRFRLDEVTPGSKKYVIYTHFGKVLDVSEAKDKDGTMITQYDFTGKNNQLWILDDIEENTSSSSSDIKK